MKFQLLIPLTFCLLIFACADESSQNSTDGENCPISFENGTVMNGASADVFGNALKYPSGDAAITSQVNVWKPGFKSPWHYHPYTGVAYVIQGELTVNFDTITPVEEKSTEKTVATTQTYKAGEKAFLGAANVWHFSENLGDKDLIFMVTWLGEENEPVAVME